MYEQRPPMLYESLETTPYAFIDTLVDFNELLAHIATCSEIAVDLEHHDYRTYLGLVTKYLYYSYF